MICIIVLLAVFKDDFDEFYNIFIYLLYFSVLLLFLDPRWFANFETFQY